MKLSWSTLLLPLVALVLLSDQGDACWRRRWRPSCIQSPCAIQPVRRDPRLQTEKRALPEFREPFRAEARDAREEDGETFVVRNHHRGIAKTTFAPGESQVFADLPSLILTLPADEDMTPKVGKDWDFDRIAEEARNVRVTAYLFAIQKESDNDFHLIIDDDGYLEEGAKLNVEISGIPDEGPDIQAVREVRNKFKDLFDGEPPTTYRPFLDPPRKVVIEGSLFFDRDHPKGTVGPVGYRPATAWEIHPIRSIRFSDN